MEIYYFNNRIFYLPFFTDLFFFHLNALNRAHLGADAAALAIVQVGIADFPFIDGNAIFGAIHGAHGAVDALGGVADRPERFPAARLVFFGAACLVNHPADGNFL